jgi:peptidoglycan hydrolase FlgJ
MTTSMKDIPATGMAEKAKMEEARGRGRYESVDKRKAAVKKVSREFEAMFAGMMLKSMRATVGKDSLTGGGQGEEVYRSLLDQEYAAAMVQGGGLGLGRLIEQQLEREIGYGDYNDTRTKP